LFFAVLLYGSESAESVSVFGIAFTDKNDIIDFGKADPKAPTKIFFAGCVKLKPLSAKLKEKDRNGRNERNKKYEIRFRTKNR